MAKDKKGNTGEENIGENNSGDGNSGNWNSGDGNSGNWNSGYGNSGYRNSGDGNSGYWNSGYGNSGNRNSGDWNSGYGSNGAFCIQEPKVRLFDKDSSYTLKEWENTKYFQLLINKFNLTKWIPEDEMTDDEKKADPDFHVRSGYLKKFTNEKAWSNLWKDCTEDEKKLIQEIPNFDATIFEQITGLKVNDNSQKQELMKKADELIQKAKELQEEAKKL